MARAFVERYLQDFNLFLHDYRNVLNLLVDFGNTKPGECPEGGLCTFGGEHSGVVSLPPVINVEPTTPSSPMIQLDQSCYTLGADTTSIRATFLGLPLPASGVWIGIYRRLDVTNDDFTQLPSLDSDLLINWILTCGRSDTCEDVGWPTQGTVELPLSLDDNTEYIVVASGMGGSTSGQAGASFQVGNC